MKLTRLILGLAACAGLCACTNDEPAANGVAQQELDGAAAYMVVKISDVGTSTRATEGNYANGSSDEYAVSDAYFYFYDDAGIYVAQADVWGGGKATENETGNIEFKGNTVVVLKGLTTNTYPKYMVTVLNRPTGFTPGGTLTEMQTKLADESAVGIMQGTNTYFTMSTSSYVNGLVAPFVNELTTANFSLEPIDLTDANTTLTPVEVYVERLAAKVDVAIDEDLAATATTLGNSKVGYQLTESFAGDDGVSGDGTNAVYVVIDGWGLNGIAKYSNIVKNIDTSWTNTTTSLGTDWVWNNTTDHRSFWGMSFNYGLGYGQYPTSSGGASSKDGEGKTLDSYLDYISYNDLTLDMDRNSNNYYTYCAENTNTAGAANSSAVLQTKSSSAITNVLVAATVCDVNGNPLDLVRFNGELYTETGYLNYVLNYLTAAGQLNVYTLDSTSDVYTQIDGSYIELAKTDGQTTRYDGYVVVVPVQNAFTGKTFYTSAGVEIDDAYSIVLAALQTFNSSHSEVNAYTGGAMYYNIPIEHLNNNEGTDGAILEANYGVVRNHWYSLTITAIENLGKGVFDPDEVIIPNEEEYYYVTANINILSWKLVSQSVEL